MTLIFLAINYSFWIHIWHRMGYRRLELTRGTKVVDCDRRQRELLASPKLIKDRFSMPLGGNKFFGILTPTSMQEWARDSSSRTVSIDQHRQQG